LQGCTANLFWAAGEQPPGDQYLIASHGQTCSSHLNGPEEKSNWSDLLNNLQCTL
jgi:hypothetical protein